MIQRQRCTAGLVFCAGVLGQNGTILYRVNMQKVPNTEGHGFESQNVQNKHGKCSLQIGVISL